MVIGKHEWINIKDNAWACNSSSLISFGNGANNNFNEKVKI